jgi:hypothetical protein
MARHPQMRGRIELLVKQDKSSKSDISDILQVKYTLAKFEQIFILYLASVDFCIEDASMKSQVQVKYQFCNISHFSIFQGTSNFIS